MGNGGARETLCPSLGWTLLLICVKRACLWVTFLNPTLPLLPFLEVCIFRVFSHMEQNLVGWVLTKAQLGLCRSRLSPKDPKEAWSWVWCLWKVVETFRYVAWLEDVHHGRPVLTETMEPSSLLLLSPSSHEVSSVVLPCAPCQDELSRHRANQSWLNPPKPWAKITLS